MLRDCSIYEFYIYARNIVDLMENKIEEDLLCTADIELELGGNVYYNQLIQAIERETSFSFRFIRDQTACKSSQLALNFFKLNGDAAVEFHWLVEQSIHLISCLGRPIKVSNGTSSAPELSKHKMQLRSELSTAVIIYNRLECQCSQTKPIRSLADRIAGKKD